MIVTKKVEELARVADKTALELKSEVSRIYLLLKSGSLSEEDRSRLKLAIDDAILRLENIEKNMLNGKK